MPQEIRVVKCYKCGVFQADIVKKANKWSCKLCGEKQSVMKEFGRGSGKDCRQHSQKLNHMKNTDDVAEANIILNMLVNGNFVVPQNQKKIIILNPKDIPTRQSNNQSKWDQYLEENKGNDNDTDTDLLPNRKRYLNDNDGSTIVSKRTKPDNAQQNLLNIGLRKDKPKVIFNDSAIFSESVEKLPKKNYTIVSKRKSLDNTQHDLLNFDLKKDEIKVVFNDSEKLRVRKPLDNTHRNFKIRKDEVKVIYNNSETFNETVEEEPDEIRSPRYRAQQRSNFISNKPKTNSKWSKFIPEDSD